MSPTGPTPLDPTPPSPTPQAAESTENRRSPLGVLRARVRAARDLAADREQLRAWFKHRVKHRLRPPRHYAPGLRLHIGCGKERLEGWCNIDLLPLPHVDLCLDVSRGLPFQAASRVFAEHFLEHLEVLDALRFLRDCQGSLADDGWIRLSTPNLDWVWTHLYSADPLTGQEDERAGRRIDKAVHINRAFYGWQHRFIWNRELLKKALVVSGFDRVRECRYGESELEDFRGIERHELYDDTPELPHVLIFEAQKGPSRPEEFSRLFGMLAHEFERCRY